MTNLPGLSDEDGKTLLADTLRMFVGHGKRLTFAELAQATGDEESKLRSYVDASRAVAMPAPVMMRVFAVLPPEAWARINTRMGFSAPGPIDVDDQHNVRRALTEASRLVTKGNEALEDGRIDHVERERLAAQAMRLLPIIAAMAGEQPSLN